MDYVIIVEGPKHRKLFNHLGFARVFSVHETGKPIREKVDEIVSELDLRKEKVCILTDLDRKGKKLYMMLKEEFLERGVKLDSSLRGILLKAQLKHIEEITDFLKKVDKIG